MCIEVCVCVCVCVFVCICTNSTFGSPSTIYEHAFEPWSKERSQNVLVQQIRSHITRRGHSYNTTTGESLGTPNKSNNLSNISHCILPASTARPATSKPTHFCRAAVTHSTLYFC